MSGYMVSFEDLVKCSPRHRDTRRSLLLAARELADRNQLFSELKAKKKLPLMELEKLTGLSRKTLERGRKYIIAMALLINSREDYLYLSSYLKLPSPAEKGCRKVMKTRNDSQGKSNSCIVLRLREITGKCPAGGSRPELARGEIPQENHLILGF